MSFFENTRKPVGLGGKIMVAMMNVGHSAVARWGLQFLNAAPDAKVLDCGCGGGATVQGIDTLEETIQLLAAGRIDATLNADVSFYDYLNVHPDADFKIVAQTEDASHVAIPLRKGDNSATLLEAVNNAIDELRADGTLKELSEKYFGQDISSEN